MGNVGNLSNDVQTAFTSLGSKNIGQITPSNCSWGIITNKGLNFNPIEKINNKGPISPIITVSNQINLMSNSFIFTSPPITIPVTKTGPNIVITNIKVKFGDIIAWQSTTPGIIAYDVGGTDNILIFQNEKLNSTLVLPTVEQRIYSIQVELKS